jgi:ATP-dependent RNA helicase DDX1
VFVTIVSVNLIFFVYQSRELSEQTYNQILKFKKHLADPVLRELLVIGGVNVKEQISTLNTGVS